MQRLGVIAIVFSSTIFFQSGQSVPTGKARPLPVLSECGGRSVFNSLETSDKVIYDGECKKNTRTDAEFWREDAQKELQRQIGGASRRIEGVAKNILFFMGDGMSVATITAARIFKGQHVDNFTYGEEAQLYLDSLPHVGVSKTFCTDFQVADSACSATAYLCGVKSNKDTIGVKPTVILNDCEGHADPQNHLSSILAWAQAAGKSTGIVTTTRVTHASPAGTYAHTANRDWESDKDVMNPENGGKDPSLCKDIASQLILQDPGKNINVILGGGRLKFLTSNDFDPENATATGDREDGINLINAWKLDKVPKGGVYVEGKEGLRSVDTTKVSFLLGLFAPSDLAYVEEQDADGDPSLEEMTRVAIQILKKNPKGFFLFVEGGRIDHAHHDNQAQRALWETLEFDKAVRQGDEMTEDEETLLVVTADHSHAMSIAGYPRRGEAIEGTAGESDVDGKPYTTLVYANGPGYRNYSDGERVNITGDQLRNLAYKSPVGVPMESETHGGDDVLILSKGPFAHFLTGVQQQSYIPHVLAYASCVGEGAKGPECGGGRVTAGGSCWRLELSFVGLSLLSLGFCWRFQSML